MDYRAYRLAMLALWLAWCVYWVASARGVKATRQRESRLSRFSHVLPLALGVTLIIWPRLPAGWWSPRLLPHTELIYALALALVAIGLAFSVWARIYLGGNWSGTVTLKEGHELIRSGPYHYVRHPIYTGILIALLGGAIASGELRAVVGLVIVAAAFLRKLRVEESFMRESFPADYERYRAEVPALIPFTKARRSAPRSAPPP